MRKEGLPLVPGEQAEQGAYPVQRGQRDVRCVEVSEHVLDARDRIRERLLGGALHVCQGTLGLGLRIPRCETDFGQEAAKHILRHLPIFETLLLGIKEQGNLIFLERGLHDLEESRGACDRVPLRHKPHLAQEGQHEDPLTQRRTYLHYHQSLGVASAALLRVADWPQAMRDRTAR